MQLHIGDHAVFHAPLHDLIGHVHDIEPIEKGSLQGWSLITLTNVHTPRHVSCDCCPDNGVPRATPVRFRFPTGPGHGDMIAQPLCDHTEAVYGPHEGCQEFTPEAEAIIECNRVAVSAVEGLGGIEAVRLCRRHDEDRPRHLRDAGYLDDDGIAQGRANWNAYEAWLEQQGQVGDDQ